MNTLFLIAFGGGLALAVYAMLHGVERSRETGVTRPAAYLNLPSVAAFMVAFGAVGYALMRNSSLSAAPTVVIAAIGGGLGWVGMSVLMAKWALRPSEPNPHDIAEEIQGQPAVVVTAISVDSLGSISYGRAGQVAPAKSIDSATLRPGTEVVIDHFDDGVAIVEDWASVERRL